MKQVWKHKDGTKITFEPPGDGWELVPEKSCENCGLSKRNNPGINNCGCHPEAPKDIFNCFPALDFKHWTPISSVKRIEKQTHGEKVLEQLKADPELEATWGTKRHWHTYSEIYNNKSLDIMFIKSSTNAETRKRVKTVKCLSVKEAVDYLGKTLFGFNDMNKIYEYGLTHVYYGSPSYVFDPIISCIYCTIDDPTGCRVLDPDGKVIFEPEGK